MSRFSEFRERGYTCTSMEVPVFHKSVILFIAEDDKPTIGPFAGQFWLSWCKKGKFDVTFNLRNGLKYNGRSYIKIKPWMFWKYID